MQSSFRKNKLNILLTRLNFKVISTKKLAVIGEYTIQQLSRNKQKFKKRRGTEFLNYISETKLC